MLIGPLERHVAPLTGKLTDLKNHAGMMSVHVNAALDGLRGAVDALMGSAGTGAFGGVASDALASLTARMVQQMNDCASACDQASQISSQCASRLSTAAEHVDRASLDWTQLSDAAATLDTGDVARRGREAYSERAAQQRDGDLAGLLSQWADDTQGAVNQAVGQLRALTQVVNDHLSAGASNSPTTIQWGGFPSVGSPITLSSPSSSIPTETVGVRRANIALELAGSRYLEAVRDPDSQRWHYHVLDEAALARDHPDWVPTIHAAADQQWEDGDLQCIAFVNMVFSLSQMSSQDGARLHTDDAGAYWNAAEFKPPQWAHIPNGQGAPQRGDMMVLADGGAGYVAIVTEVTPSSVTFANTHADRTVHTFPMSKEGAVMCGWDGYTVQGFIRQVS